MNLTASKLKLSTQRRGDLTRLFICLAKLVNNHPLYSQYSAILKIFGAIDQYR